MDFLKVLDEICGALDRANIRYALIGGFAMAMRGVQRATVDLDFILLMDDLDRAHELLRSSGYRRAFHSDNVSHYRAEDSDYGRIDILHAFRRPSLSMLDRAERVELSPGVSVPVARVEDIIGLKIQAVVNDPERETQDWLDIRLLLEAAANQAETVDWGLLAEYLRIFNLHDRLESLKEWYGQAE
jgi:predicted nucleotidyltransferase